MVGPLEGVLGFFKQGDPLFELEAMLDDVLSHIAFDNFDKDYVEKMRKELIKYGDFVKTNLDGVPSFMCTSPILVALDCLGNAYHGFIDPFMADYGWDGTPESREEAESILGEEGFLGGDIGIPIGCAVQAYENENSDAWKMNIGWRSYSDGSFELDYEN